MPHEDDVIGKRTTDSRVMDGPDNVIVFQLLEKADFTDGGAGHPLILRLEPDLLERYDLVRVHVAGLVDDTVRS